MLYDRGKFLLRMCLGEISMALFIPEKYKAPLFLFYVLSFLYSSAVYGERGTAMEGKGRGKSNSSWSRPKDKLDHRNFIEEADITELPEAYRAPYKGVQTVRPSKFGIMGGGRAPGIGFLFDYSFDRLGIGASASYRSFYGLIKEVENTDLLGSGQAFWNLYAFYHFVPFNFSPYAILGIELGEKTKHAFSVMFGIGMEIRVFTYSGWTVLLEYVYHKADEKAYPGIALGYSF